ncbi:hypothetical protein [Hoylesella loescheii]|uniref:hypothetical protein n=1 Tax=Hoylesella loescheii TaxID=840 RepID=UPI0028E3608B|nr:hypothetical protein [Hoylesella loescheii]
METNNLKSMAEQYAISVLQDQINTIAHAYIEGYNKSRAVVVENDIEYIDLGLPSGTLWPTKFLNDEGMVYCDAKSYKLPTKEQYEEFRKLRWRIVENKYIIITGLNGNEITLPWRYSLTFWLADQEMNPSFQVPIAVFWSGNTAMYTHEYVGDKVSVLTVK